MDDKAVKQNYLKSHIQDRGYNLELFAEHMSILKANGTDINLWTLDELKNVVNDFVSKQNLRKRIRFIQHYSPAVVVSSGQRSAFLDEDRVRQARMVNIMNKRTKDTRKLCQRIRGL